MGGGDWWEDRFVGQRTQARRIRNYIIIIACFPNPPVQPSQKSHDSAGNSRHHLPGHIPVPRIGRHDWGARRRRRRPGPRGRLRRRRRRGVGLGARGRRGRGGAPRLGHGVRGGGGGLGRRAAGGRPAREVLGRGDGQLGALVLRASGDVGAGRGASAAAVEAAAELAVVGVKVADDSVGLAEGVGVFAGADREDGGREGDEAEAGEEGLGGHVGRGGGRRRGVGAGLGDERRRDGEGVMAI